VFCGQTVGWIKMKLRGDVGLGPGHTVLDGDPASPPQTRHSPQLSAHVCCGQTVGWIKKFKAPLGTDVDLGPDNIVLDGDHAPPPKKIVGATAPHPPNFGPCIVAKRQHRSGWHFVRGKSQPKPPGRSSLLKRGTAAPPQFSDHVCCGQTAGWIEMPCLLWPIGWMDQDATWYGDRRRAWPHCVKQGPQRVTHPDFRLMSVVAIRLDRSRGHLVAR